MQNELSQIGKRKKSRKRSGIFLISKLFGKDTYITLKLMFVRFKENFLITATIMMIVVISSLGNSLFNLISYTNDLYYKEYFLTDTVVTSSSSILYKDFAKYYELLQNTDGLDASIVLWAPFDATYNNEPLRFVIADFDAMEQQRILKNSSTDENRIVLSKKLAEKYNVSTGDFIKVLTPPKYILDSHGIKQGISEKPYEVRMCVTAIIPEDAWKGSNAYIDIKCNDFMKNDCYFNTVYINGDQNTTDQLLAQLKSIHTGLKWESYDNMMAISHKALKERYIMFEIVVGILTLIAGLGWFNAIRYTLLSRTKEYDILRINGMTVRRLRRMLFVHIAIYLCIGVVLGVFVGMGAFAWITYLERGKSIVVINLRSFALISSYLILLCMLLIPDILKISKEKIITNE
jgi:ABC-type antimicrobial peptide transport system permease subunit